MPILLREFYLLGERAILIIDGKRYRPLGADGATVVVNNWLEQKDSNPK